jgi:glycine hydroxymethyltransferase
MGTAEMEELGAIIALVLQNTSPAPDPKDAVKKSKARYLIAENAKKEALERVKKLLDRFPVYPELDLGLLKRAFVE